MEAIISYSPIPDTAEENSASSWFWLGLVAGL